MEDEKIISGYCRQLDQSRMVTAELTDPEACVGCASCAIMCPDCIIEVER